MNKLHPPVTITYLFSESTYEDIVNGTAVWEPNSCVIKEWRDAVSAIASLKRGTIVNTKLVNVECNDLEGFRAYAARFTSGVKNSPGVTF